jgi:transposase-like protein
MAKRGRRRKYKLKNEACPNPECHLYGKTAKGNIVSNGTYPTKEGTSARRFLCKQCGHSFCGREGTIFYDLRSPEDKVLMAIKLLVKGMPLRGVAEVLEVKLDTVRHWLKVAAEQSEKIDALLMKELKVSPIELDALWSFVKKNSLRQRAILWRARFGSGLPLPKNIA